MERKGLTRSQRIGGLAAFVFLCLGAGAVGAVATGPEIDGWYATIRKPVWNPPGFVFGPVWSALYVMMGIAAWLVWKQGGVKPARKPLGLFAAQLLLNVAWSWIFFNQHLIGWAFVEIVVLWLAIAATTFAFAKQSKTAAWLMLPYLCWVSFASLLNFTIWRLN